MSPYPLRLPSQDPCGGTLLRALLLPASKEILCPMAALPI
jgi:hypothetical protein